MSRPGRFPSKPARVSINCFTCQNRDRSEWCNLDPSDVKVLNERKLCLAYAPGQMLYEQGEACEGIFVIEQGTVAVRKADKFGNTVLLRLCHAGETVGYRDFLAGGSHTTSADALVNSTVCRIGRGEVRALLDRNPALGLRFVQRMAQDLETAEDAILQTSALPVRMRLAHLLLMLKDRYGTMGDDGVLKLELPLARQDIAAILGARPETIARTLHALENDGVARFSGRTVIIPDLDLLLDEVERLPGP
jgi:CRP/FNR family transcriptional regulator